MPPGLEGLVNVGAIGIVLVWFMWRMDTRLERLETAMDRLAHTLALKMLSEGSEGEIHRQAEKILQDLQAKAKGL